MNKLNLQKIFDILNLGQDNRIVQIIGWLITSTLTACMVVCIFIGLLIMFALGEPMGLTLMVFEIPVAFLLSLPGLFLFTLPTSIFLDKKSVHNRFLWMIAGTGMAIPSYFIIATPLKVHQPLFFILALLVGLVTGSNLHRNLYKKVALPDTEEKIYVRRTPLKTRYKFLLIFTLVMLLLFFTWMTMIFIYNAQDTP